MAIGRVSGPMLLRNLERLGLDLSIDGNLVYFDVTQRRVGINTLTPNVELDVVGNVDISSSLFVGETVTVGNLYMLPTVPGYEGQILTRDVGMNTSWSTPMGSFRRRTYSKTIDNLKGFGKVNFDMNLGVSSIVYNLTVNRPVQVEIFSTPDRLEDNPYTFIATPDHLTDDGTVILNDGSSFQSRQYSILANLEDPPQPNVFVTISSIDEYLADTPVIMSIVYFPAATDSTTTISVLSELPTTGYEGKLIFVSSEGKTYVWSNGAWRKL